MTSAQFGALLSIAGLSVTALGAFIAAKAVMLTEEQADNIAATYWDDNHKLFRSLLAQSASARNGLLLVVAGTVGQIAGVFISAFAA
jgi:hypothetical protein